MGATLRGLRVKAPGGRSMSGFGGGVLRLVGSILLVAGVVSGCGRPGDDYSARMRASAPVVAPSPDVVVAPVKASISKAGLAYFLEVAFGADLGDNDQVITMWDKPVVTVRVRGASAKSRSCLNQVIADFNGLTARTDLKVVSGAPDIELFFGSGSKFRVLEPHYEPGNDGFYYLYWSGKHEITSANVFVRSSGISERDRCHLIRMGLTGAMGLSNQSAKYPDSVFYQDYGTTPTRYSALDKELVALMYGGVVRPGDGKDVIKQTVTVK
ncbi:DUF2927 domain-containing protein [Actinoplanes sp. NPDC000266]